MVRLFPLCLILTPFLIVAGPLAAADDPKLESEEVAVQAWGAAHPDCAEWSDACVVCRRGADGPACSTPGIACEPAATACRAR